MPDGSVAPDGRTLSLELSAHFGISTASLDLAKVAQLVEISAPTELSGDPILLVRSAIYAIARRRRLVGSAAPAAG